ncbi:MAG TPA: Tim44-like domain-containing protein [Burkholderiales bacterium]|nr:Tim44-like domain-containing protein [Burkholderiales bacterium]
MGRLLFGLSWALFGAALFAADATPAAAHGGWLPTLGALALGGLLGSLFGGSGFGAAFILTLLAVISVVALHVFSKPRREPAATPQLVAPPPGATRAPAGFDVAGFLRGAKLNFVQLQTAHDLGRLDQVREFTTAEMYDKLKAGLGPHQADVVALNADLLEIGSEGERQLASVRFSGMARAAPGAAPVGFVEVWSLAKPADGASGWLLAGIQQMH